MTDNRDVQEDLLWELESYLSSKQKDVASLDEPVFWDIMRVFHQLTDTRRKVPWRVSKLNMTAEVVKLVSSRQVDALENYWQTAHWYSSLVSLLVSQWAPNTTFLELSWDDLRKGGRLSLPQRKQWLQPWESSSTPRQVAALTQEVKKSKRLPFP